MSKNIEALLDLLRDLSKIEKAQGVAMPIRVSVEIDLPDMEVVEALS